MRLVSFKVIIHNIWYVGGCRCIVQLRARWLQRAGNFSTNKNYYDLHLHEETNRYLFRILTFNYISENADTLRFKIASTELYNEIPYRTKNVTSSISNLAQWAIDNATTYKILKLMNPWIRGRSLSASAAKSYVIKLPANTSQ